MIDPQHHGALALAGNALLALARHAEALPYLGAAEAASASKITSVQIALCLEAAGEFGAAEHRLRAVLAQEPSYVTRQAAVLLYSHNPAVADVHAHLARVLQRRGDNVEARLHYQLAKLIDPHVELDPLYLKIMTQEELEDYPIDRGLS